MKKIRIDNKTIEIDCDNTMCGNCSYKPDMSGFKCNLFDVSIDHVRSGYSKDSGWKRCSKCINAEG